MFAKLRKKIEEESQTELGRAIPQTVTPSISRSGSESSPRGSVAQLNVDGHQLPTSVDGALHWNGPQRLFSASVDDLVQGFAKKDELHSDGNDSDRSNESSKHSKRKSAYSSQSRLSDLNFQTKEQIKHDRNYQEQFLHDVNKKGQEWKEKILQLEKEKADLNAQLLETQKRMDKLIESQENKEELENFQNQEMSKIKHLLLKSQQELRGCEEKLKAKEETHENANIKINQLQSTISSLEQQLVKANNDLSQVHNLQMEKQQFEEEIDHLKQDSLKTSSILEEKENYIIHLTDRITILDKRLSDTTLTGDEREQALINERLTLEKKLEESRQQLNDIKTTWSEKINTLENQIYHLNKKMADDNQECTKLENELSETRETLSVKEEKLWKMEERMQEQEKELEKLKLSSENEIRSLEESYKIIQEDLETKIVHLEENVNKMKQDWDKERQEAQVRINQLVATQTEHVEKELEVERQLTQLENENHKLKSTLSEREKECLQLTEIATNYEHKIKEIQTKFDELEKDLTNSHTSEEHLQSILCEKETEIRSLAHEKDNLLVRNAELSHQLKLVKQELYEEQTLREREKESSEERIKQLEKELESKKKMVKDLEDKLTESTENSDHVKQLKSTLSDLENQLSDKNKIIKLQQQRLSDMKKTLQRELKMQSAIDGIGHLDSSDIPMIQPTDSRISSGWSQGKDIIPNRKSNHVDVEVDINFQYLKHVIFKFMTSEDYEAQHLVKAISVLLRFTAEEEKLIKQTMEWKTSWFRTRPRVKGHPLLS